MNSTGALKPICGAALSLLTISCDAKPISQTFVSYDDCILATVSKAPNSDAIAQLQAACGRKFETKSDLALEVTESADPNNEISVKNMTNTIVTKFELDAGGLGKWERQDWIEPGRWVDLETPANSSKIRKAAQAGKVKARAILAIPITEAKK